MANLIPYTKSSIIKRQKSAIIKADKFLNTKTKSSIIEPKKSAIVKADKFLNTKSTKVNENSFKPKQSENSSEDIILQIEKKVIKIDKLLKDSFALKKKQQKKVRIKGEQKEFEDREKELEKKKPKKEPGVNLPTPPKMGFFDWIKNFVFNTILGFLTVRLMKFLPTLLKIYPVIIGAGEFLINVGGNLLNSLVSFVDWGYKAVDATSGFIKSIGGEGLSKVFDNFMGAIDNVLEFAVMAALVSSGGDDESDSGGLGGKGGRKGFDSTGRRVGTKVQQRYERRFGKDKFVDRFGTKNLKNVAQGAGRGAFQQGTRNAFVGLAGKGGAKSILKFVRPLTNKLPIIGGLLNFGLSVALGEDPGRAAFKAIGSTLVGALGAAIGSLAFGVGGIIGGIIGGIGGDALGGALYDMFFNNKKPTQKQGKTNKLAGGGSPVPTRGGRKPAPTRTLKKKKSTRTLSFNPRKIQPGRSAGGEAKIQSVFPNPNKPTPAWWDPLGVFTGKKPEQQQSQQKKPKGKTPNSQEFLIKSNEVLGRAQNFGGFATLIIKTLLGDDPDDLDYLNSAKGLNSFMQGIFKPGTLGFSGGGEVDARAFFQGEDNKDNTKIISKLIKESVSKEVDRTIRNLKNEMSLKSASKDSEDHDDMGGGGGGGGGEGGGGGGEGGGYNDSPHGTPGPAVQATSGFNPGKGDKTRKIFLHWTAGDHSTNFNNYHTTFLGNGRAVRNRGYGVDGTEHTGGANTNSVGLAIAAMKDGAENRFGSFPPTSAQVSAMALEAARLAVAWGWDESTIEKNVRTHGEWERYATKSGILPGRPQKWDLDKLRQSDPTNSGGDKLRKMIKSYFKKLKTGATVDSSGKVISKTTGSPLAQMSLETAMEMTGSGTNVSGGNADFWTLVAVASREDGDPQGRADVAQSIYNRVAAGVFPGGKDMKKIILARTQYQPTRDYPKKNPSGDTNPEWHQITDAESAAKATGMDVSTMKSVAKQIMDPTLRKKAAEYIENRTDFVGRNLTPSRQSSTELRRRTSRNNIFGNFVGPGSFEYGRKKLPAAQVSNFGNLSVSPTGGSGTYESGTGGKGYGSAGGKLAGELGRYIDSKGLGNKGSGVHRHPEHPPYSLTSGHSRGSLHYQGRAVDIGSYTSEQGPILAAVAEFNKMKGIKPTQLLHGKNEPKDHWNHVHVAYARGGETLNGPHQVLIGEEGTEYVIDNKSFETTENFLPGLLDVLNYNVNDKASLIKYLPNIISSISQYTDDNIMKEYIFIQSPPEIRYVSTGSGGSPNIFIGGGVNNNIEQTLCQIG